MKSSFMIYSVWIFALLLASTQACDRKNNPCSSRRCCLLVFHLKSLGLSYSFCSSTNTNPFRCASSDDYCLTDDDCDGAGVCQGGGILSWGRCVGSPCVKKNKRHEEGH